jgi:hypothetical protein
VVFFEVLIVGKIRQRLEESQVDDSVLRKEVERSSADQPYLYRPCNDFVALPKAVP